MNNPLNYRLNSWLALGLLVAGVLLLETGVLGFVWTILP